MRKWMLVAGIAAAVGSASAAIAQDVIAQRRAGLHHVGDQFQAIKNV